jgi:molybdate transport system substrate-binding protein
MRSVWLALLVLVLSATARAEDPVRVYAAASLTQALGEIADLWPQSRHARPALVFAASSALAKQVEHGANVDLFASADRRWMDYLAQRNRIEPGSRVDLLGNALVLIAPRGRGVAVRMDPGFDLPGAFEGRLCTGEPGSVPAGTYAKQALVALGWWTGLASRVVGTEDTRAALAFVERGECPLGIVYATDAAISGKVEIVGRFPAGTHEPIVYPFAVVSGAGPPAHAFLRFLRSEAAHAVFRRHGFTAAPPP